MSKNTDDLSLEALRAYNAALDDLLAHLTLIIDNLRVDVPAEKPQPAPPPPSAAAVNNYQNLYQGNGRYGANWPLK